MANVRDEGLFDGVKLEDVKYVGRRFRFPIRYYDHQRISAAFPASAAKVQSILPSDKLTPVQAGPGTTLVRMTGYEYRNIDGLAPYREFSISVPVLYKKAGSASGLPGAYVIHLPVTTEEARWAGVEIYGFPKFIAEITFEDTADARRCRVCVDGVDIVTLDAPKVPAEPASNDYYAYTVKDEQLLRTLIRVKGQWGTSRVPEGASCILGDHPIARELRGLDVGRTSLEHAYAPEQQMMLHLPGERMPL